MPDRDTTEIITFTSGLRLVYTRRPGARVDCLGVAVRVGSRDDDPGCHGLAHFVEHTIFKGTARRSSYHVINRMEAVGGELNAFTTKEETVVYSIAPAGNAARALELIADLVTASRFPAAELDKEREVVADEIDSYLDTPSEAVYDDFEDLMFDGSSLGHNILGTKQALGGFTSQTCRDYLARWYTAPNMVAFYSGAAPLSRIEALVSRHLDRALGCDVPARASSPAPAVAPFAIRRRVDTHQCHVVAGSRLPGMFSPDRHAIALFNNIVGGPGMNSLLNVALREKRGLVYMVESAVASYTDVSCLTVYYGCDPADARRCARLVADQIDALAQTPLSPRRLAAAKKQLLGQMLVAGDNRENSTLAAARSVLFRGSVASPERTAALIDAVTSDSLLGVARAVADGLSSLTFAPGD